MLTKGLLAVPLNHWAENSAGQAYGRSIGMKGRQDKGIRAAGHAAEEIA
jgi:hypothetical protein